MSHSKAVTKKNMYISMDVLNCHLYYCSVFLSHCCFQEFFLILTHNLCLLCLSLEGQEGEWCMVFLAGVLNRGTPFLNHDRASLKHLLLLGLVLAALQWKFSGDTAKGWPAVSFTLTVSRILFRFTCRTFVIFDVWVFLLHIFQFF